MRQGFDMQKELRYTAQVCRVRPYYSMSHPMFADFWRRASRLPEAADAAIADNCRFDERTDTQRWQALAQYLPPALPLDALTMEDWAEAECIHRKKRITVPSLSIPDTFLDINRPAWLTAPDPKLILVRVESLVKPLNIWGLSYHELDQMLKEAKKPTSGSTKTLMENMKTWNRQRDNRPCFSAFLSDVQAEADHPDWPHQLRDRLGLGHYSPEPGAKIPVALMRYSIKDVLHAQKSRGLATACALPGALDDGMHEYFFPTPVAHPFGATLHLNSTQADCLSAEILHCRIDYQAKHLWKLGYIELPHALASDSANRDECLRKARDVHLGALRKQYNCADFGENMVGRV